MNDSYLAFNANEMMELLRGLESRGIRYQIEYCRTSSTCDGLVVRIPYASEVWEIGFYDYGHMEVGKFALSGDVKGGVTADSLLSELDSVSTE